MLGQTTLVSLEFGHELYVTAWGSDQTTNGFYHLKTWIENAPEQVEQEEEVIEEAPVETLDPPIVEEEPEVIVDPIVINNNDNSTVILDDIPINEDAAEFQEEELD